MKPYMWGIREQPAFQNITFTVRKILFQMVTENYISDVSCLSKKAFRLLPVKSLTLAAKFAGYIFYSNRK